MISIPLPFVLALLLFILMILLFIRREDTHSAFIFVALCTVTTTVVGLRWTFDHQIFRLLQPILASCIPATAWYCFSSARNNHRIRYWHWLPPVFIAICSFTYQFWQPPLDPILVLLYLAYGIALIGTSCKTSNIPELVRFSDINNALKAQRYAGIMLLMSALIDAAIAINFIFYSGVQVPLILSIAHLTLMPLHTVLVIIFSLSIAPRADDNYAVKSMATDTKDISKGKPLLQLSRNEVTNIVNKVDELFKSKEAFLDPDLTLDKLARKVGIPAKQISAAINQFHGRNISQVVNEYRIEKAKTLLSNTDKPITQIYFDSSFQTKSNFNREFHRVTQQTPSAFRHSHQANTI